MSENYRKRAEYCQTFTMFYACVKNTESNVRSISKTNRLNQSGTRFESSRFVYRIRQHWLFQRIWGLYDIALYKSTFYLLIYLKCGRVEMCGRLALSALGEAGRSDQQPEDESSERDDFVHLCSVFHLHEPHFGRIWQRLSQHQCRKSLLRRCHAYWRYTRKLRPFWENSKATNQILIVTW